MSLFITFEGGEGSGKTTQISLLKDYLINVLNVNCITTREPGGTSFAERIRDLVKYYDGDDQIDNKTELLLMLASRNQHVKNIIEPNLKNDINIICDRFYDSTFVYQGIGRQISLDFIKQINDNIISGYKPDLTFLLDIDVIAGLSRINNRNNKKDRLDNLDYTFHNKIRQGYLDLYNSNKDRIKLIDCNNKSIEQISNEIKNIVKKKLCI